MPSDSDVWAEAGLDYSMPLSGNALHWAAQKASRVVEEYILLFSREEVDYYLGEAIRSRRELISLQEFDGKSAWEPEILFSKAVFDAETEGYRPIDEAEVADEVAGAHSISLVEWPELERRLFWSLIDSANRSQDFDVWLSDSLQALTVDEIKSFAVSVNSAIESLNTLEVNQSAGEEFFPGSDSFLFWRAAVVAAGEQIYGGVLSVSAPVVFGEDRWDAGGLLLSAAERAYESKTGDAAQFGWQPVSLPVSSAGKLDRAPGPRDQAAMYRRGLLPVIVGSRFLVNVDGELVGCVASQHIDVRSEDVSFHVREAAVDCSRRMGGTLASSVEWMATHTMEHWSGMTLFESRHRLAVPFEEYVALAAGGRA